MSAAPAAGPLADEKVAVIVVLYNSEAHLPALVGSLAAGLEGVAYQLVGVDNASPDGSADLLERLVPEAVVVRTGHNGGYAAGINAGVRAAGPHTALLALNSDVQVGPGCVATLLRRLRATGAGIAVPRLLDARGELISSIRREPRFWRSFFDAVLGTKVAGGALSLGEVVTRRSAYDHEQRVDWAEGSVQLVSAECWAQCGPWDESFFLYCEETDFGLRARDAGCGTLYVPQALATHLEGGSSVEVDWLWQLQVANRLELYRRRNTSVGTALFWAATLLRELSRAALGRTKNRAAVRTLLGVQRARATTGMPT